MEDQYGINIEAAHPRARELAPEEFFWSCVDELGPFGSDEGDMALAEYRGWRQQNPNSPLIDCLIWTVESVGEMKFSDYNDSLLAPELIGNQVSDSAFDDQQFVFTLDISVIATGFGELADVGTIDLDSKPVISLALQRQILWSQAQTEWTHAGEYIRNLNILIRVLKEA